MKRALLAVMLLAALAACESETASSQDSAADAGASDVTKGDAGAADAGPTGPPRPAGWLKGNTHTHTSRSDGDSSPGVVARWYRDHAYDFLVITDHNVFTPIEDLQRALDGEVKRDGAYPLLLIAGEELTNNPGGAPVHVNAFDSTAGVGEQPGDVLTEVIQASVDGIRAASGIPVLNHPFYKWALTPAEVLPVSELAHFELYNGHTGTHSDGGLDEFWDALLTDGLRVWGVATDDAHVFKTFAADKANPGRGWIMVRAAEPTAAAIRAAVATGDFYSSTGVTLEAVETDGRTLSVLIQGDGDATHTTRFITTNGTVAAEVAGAEASYTLQSVDEGYVRARVEASDGTLAWTQPLFWE